MTAADDFIVVSCKTVQHSSRKNGHIIELSKFEFESVSMYYYGAKPTFPSCWEPQI